MTGTWETRLLLSTKTRTRLGLKSETTCDPGGSTSTATSGLSWAIAVAASVAFTPSSSGHDDFPGIGTLILPAGRSENYCH